tara:strand:- start:83734 stop:84204 length:471 start_codon:yes stop_codon:yes gene_type:complete
MIFQNSWGHGGENHSEEKTASPAVHNQIVSSNKNLENIYKTINTNYKKRVKPIFEKSCFDCHSGETNYPWYYKIPGIKQLIDSDIKEAKVHLDFSNDFPFLSHETPIKDLKSIFNSLEEERMPPQRYLWFHGENNLTEKEFKEVKRWISESLEAME